MKQVHVALGAPGKFVKLGNFTVKARDKSVRAFYNMDFGDKREEMFDLMSGMKKDVKKAHQSFHPSGNSHTKLEEKGSKLFKGQTSDCSPMNDPNKTPLILGIESFHLDAAPTKANAHDSSTVFLSPPNGIQRYSILWLWMPKEEAKIIHPRWFYLNLIGGTTEYRTFQTAGIGDLAIGLETQTVVEINGWEIRALFLDSLMHSMTHDRLLQYPKGIDSAWRSFAFIDAHLHLSTMIETATLKKRPVLFVGAYQIAPQAKTSMNWLHK